MRIYVTPYLARHNQAVLRRRNFLKLQFSHYMKYSVKDFILEGKSVASSRVKETLGNVFITGKFNSLAR